ncbi:zinc finger ccch domain-containing protein zfn-like [Quercus suber]|uniref:Zinc finger ccch domain-containing protein zfn-like n=1 Tax=Quercus suber TaxID=58331 RepID=A0AAW0LFN3_QUESU|nr:zinc finger ccch domain-containing protein zfn-like [Quercus suber]
MGLPLRLGEALCIFYSCYGFCKFGPSCKFEHLIDISKYLSLSSSGTAGLSLSSEELDDAGKGQATFTVGE